MRVLHLDTELTWRGGENQLRLLLEGLAGTTVESRVAVRPGSAAADRLARIAPVHQVQMRGGMDLRAAWHLARYVRAERIQLVDAHTGNAHSLGLLLKAFVPEVKLVVHRRVDNVPKNGLAHRLKYMSPKVDRFVAISHAIRNVLVTYGVPEARVSVVRSAVPTDAYKRIDKIEAKRKLASAYGIDPALVFLGNASALSHQKGYETLLDATKRLKDQGRPFHCFIAGDGELTSALERQRAALGLEHDVTFLGFIDQVPEFLAALDILAAPSRNEGLGTVLLDALGAGCALAVSNVGGMPEIVKHDETGLLSPVEDDAKLAANLADLIQYSDLRSRYVAAGQALVAREFSVAAMVGGNLDVYRELLSP